MRCINPYIIYRSVLVVHWFVIRGMTAPRSYPSDVNEDG